MGLFLRMILNSVHVVPSDMLSLDRVHICDL
jgi:hypothetical protein